jgi:hypothetical protein
MNDKTSSDGAQSRPLTAQEEIYWRLTYNDQIHPVLAAEVKGRTTTDQWRMAIDLVQRRHPLLQVKIEMPSASNEFRQPMFVAGQGEIIPLRLGHSLDERSIAEEIERELATPFLSGQAPLARCVILHEAERSVFILAISHSIADGMSALLLVRDVLNALSGRSLEISPIPMPPTAEELLGLTPVVPSRVPPEGNNVSINAGRKPTVLLHSLSVQATKELLFMVRAQALTIHAALVASFVLALSRQRPNRQMTPVRVISPVNTRGELAAGDVLGLYFTSPQSSFAALGDKSFWDIAFQVRADAKFGSSRHALVAATTAMQSLTKPGLSNHDAAEMLQGAFAMDMLVTNLGRTPFASNFGELSLDKVWGPAVLGGLDDTQTIGVVTTNDQLCLTLTSRRPVPYLLETATSILIDQEITAVSL